MGHLVYLPGGARGPVSLDFRELPPSAKLVLGYLLIEHLINGREWVTINDIVFNVGITERRLRSIMKMLREAGLVEAFLDPSQGRRHLYRLSFSKLEIEKPNVPGGLYLIDLDKDSSIPWDLTLRAYAIIRSSSMLLYTGTMRGLAKLLELTKCTCLTLDLELVDIDPVLGQVAQLVMGNRVVSVLFDSRHDSRLVGAIIKRARELGISPTYVNNNLGARGMGTQWVVERGHSH